MTTDLPPNVPLCPVAYEVFSSQKNVDGIFGLLSSKGLLLSQVRKEDGDVGRFTLFIKSGAEYELDLFGIVENNGGRALPVAVIAPGQPCRTNPTTIWMNTLKPSELVVLLDKPAAKKIKIDSIRSGLTISAFRGKKGKEIIHFVVAEGLSGYSFSSIIYRMERGDYGNVSYGPIVSLKDLAEQQNARWEGTRPE
jgi:hypothetical protein